MPLGSVSPVRFHVLPPTTTTNQQHHRSLKLTMVNRLGGKMSLSQYQTALAAVPRQLPALLPAAVVWPGSHQHPVI